MAINVEKKESEVSTTSTNAVSTSVSSNSVPSTIAACSPVETNNFASTRTEPVHQELTSQLAIASSHRTSTS